VVGHRLKKAQCIGRICSVGGNLALLRSGQAVSLRGNPKRIEVRYKPVLKLPILHYDETAAAIREFDCSSQANGEISRTLGTVRRFRPHPDDVPIRRSFPSAMYATGTQ